MVSIAFKLVLLRRVTFLGLSIVIGIGQMAVSKIEIITHDFLIFLNSKILGTFAPISHFSSHTSPLRGHWCLVT